MDTDRPTAVPPADSAPRVAVLGMGLMGGSLGLALRSTPDAWPVAGYARRAETRRVALEMGAADEVFDDPADAARGADIVVVCAPVLAIPELTARVAPALADGAVVTDVGSTKAWIVDRAREAIRGARGVRRQPSGRGFRTPGH